MPDVATSRVRQLVTVLTAGLVVGAILTFFNVSLTALIFKGELKPYLAQGISLVLTGTVVLVLTTSILSSLPNVISVPQEIPIGILAVLAADISVHLDGAPTDQIYATVLGAILVSTLFTGVLFWLLGRFQLGALVRFIPFPVIGGFLAGTGWLLFLGALRVMADGAPAGKLLHPDDLIYWLPGLAMGIIILLILRRRSHFLLMPALIVGGLALFYLVMGLLGITPATAMANGWLLGPLPSGRLWEPAAVLAVKDAHWSTVFQHHILSLAAIPLINVVALLLNATALELALGRDADLNRELRAGGISNLLATLVGSPSGFLAVAETSLGQRLGADSRMLGYVITALTIVTLFFGASLMAFIPRVVAGGILCFMGLAFLVEWLYDSWFRVSRIDYVMIWIIMLAISLGGFLQGVAIGILIAAILFVFNYSRIEAVRHMYTRHHYPSHVARSPAEDELLEAHGSRIVMTELHGYLFFGTSHRLFSRLRTRLDEQGLDQIRFVLLDFRLVTGMDSSVTTSFQRLVRHLAQADVQLVLTGMIPSLEAAWTRDVVANGQIVDVPIFPTLDLGLVWCENQILAAVAPRTELTVAPSFVDYVLAMLPMTLSAESEKRRASLAAAVEECHYAQAELIVRAGEEPEGLFYLEEGEVIVQACSPDGVPLILRRMRPGAVIGEISLYTGGGASADVVAGQPTRLSRISRAAIDELERTNPDVAIALHRMLARDLSKKLIYSSRTVSVIKA